MKKVKFLFAVAIATIISSCSQTNVSPSSDQTLSASQVPTVVQSSLTASFPSASNTTWSKVSPTVYQASFQSNVKSMLSSITATGILLYSHGQIDPSTLPAAIVTYLDKNYAGYVIMKAGSKTDSAGVVLGYLVEFSLNSIVYELRFDASGAFLSLEMGDGSRECKEVAKADLPSAITTYLDTNYNGYTFNHARTNKTNGTISGYGVEITYNAAEVRLLFDASGVFVSLDTAVDNHRHPQDSTKLGDRGKGGSHNKPTLVTKANLLTVITTYLDTNYPGYTFVDALAFAKDTTIIGYGVSITYQNKSYKIEFDAKGAFVKVH
jgi:hypothetical protein